MTTQYLYTSPQCPGAKVLVTYENGHLAEMSGLQHIGRLWEHTPINLPIPFRESEVEKMATEYRTQVACQKIAMTSVGEKTAAFCRAYKKHLGIPYNVRKGEPSKLKDLKLDSDLLDLYFTNKEWWGKQPKSVRNLATNYNALLQLKNIPMQKKNNYPGEPDLSFEKKLSTAELPSLWKHWRAKGFKPVKGRGGRVTHWERAGAIVLVVLFSFGLFSGCGLTRAVSQLFQPPVPQPDSIELVVRIVDSVAVTVPEDSLYTDWKGFWGNGPIIFSDPLVQVEIVEADSATYWWWFDRQPEAVKKEIVKKGKKLLRAKVVMPEREVKGKVEIDTTLKVKNPARDRPPTIIPNAQHLGTAEGVLLAIISLMVAIVFFFVHKRRDGKD